MPIIVARTVGIHPQSSEGLPNFRSSCAIGSFGLHRKDGRAEGFGGCAIGSFGLRDVPSGATSNTLLKFCNFGCCGSG